MDVSLGALRSRLFALRSWDSTGETLNNRIRAALNTALDRLAGDVPEALVPDEEHIALRAPVDSTSSTVDAKAYSFSVSEGGTDSRLLEFVDSANTPIAKAGSLTTWRPTVTGEWDGVMHLEIKDSNGVWHRRQSREWFTKEIPTGGQNSGAAYDAYYVSLDRPFEEIEGTDFRIYQPEFFISDDVMELLEPARIWDGSRQQVWKIDTAGAHRQDMVSFQGDSGGRPYRMWRGRHFQVQAPSEPPQVVLVKATQSDPSVTKQFSWGRDSAGFAGTTTLRAGTWAVRYTYVWGRRDREWQQSPSVSPGGTLADFDSSEKLTWAYEEDASVVAGVSRYSGVTDPIWESAPSPTTIVRQARNEGLVISATNIDSMLGFGDSSQGRYGRSGLRIRYYVSQLSRNRSTGDYNAVETNQRFYLLCEVEPTFDQLTLSPFAAAKPDEIRSLGNRARAGARFVWNGTQLYDYYRPLKHSTGYYAWKVYPQQDARYELDFRVLRLPRKYIDDQDTAPIQRDAVPALMELALYYVSLVDGNDQASANAHLARYQDLARQYRKRYANPGNVIEPTPLSGYPVRHRYGTFDNNG